MRFCEGELPAEMGLDYFLGLACNVATKAAISERELERFIGLPFGFFGKCERGEDVATLPVEVFLEMLLHHPELARFKR